MCMCVCVWLEGLIEEALSRALPLSSGPAFLLSWALSTTAAKTAHLRGEKMLERENDKLKELEEQGWYLYSDENWKRRAEKDEHHMQ